MQYFQPDPWYDVDEPEPGDAPRTLKVFRQPPGEALVNTVEIRAPAVVLEVEHFAYHTGSSVTLPCLPSPVEDAPQSAKAFEDPSVVDHGRAAHPSSYSSFEETRFDGFHDDDVHDRHAMVLVAIFYRFLEENPNFKLIVAGHTDSTGSDAINFDLSDKRAANVLYLLTGERDKWVENALDTGKTEDVQRILKHYSHANGWPHVSRPTTPSTPMVLSKAAL